MKQETAKKKDSVVKTVMLDPDRKSPRAKDFEDRLLAFIVGQERAVRRMSGIFQIYLAGMNNPARPLGTMLFLGPTGSGKTRVVEAAAEVLFGEPHAVVKIDCAEFQHSHEIAKLIGSPPGYLGHRETHPMLSQEVLNQYHTDRVKLSFVLFDEIEKASDALWNLLLGILDKATLTLGDNRRVDFSRAVIFMTSNLGATEMNSILRPGLGFAACEAERQQAAGIVGAGLSEKLGRVAVDAARRKFTPEFVNRIDKTIVFRPLGDAELRRILSLELNIVQQRVFNSSSGAPFVFSLTDSARDFLLREGTDMKYGARHLKRAIDRNLLHPLSNLIATRQVRGGDLVRIDFDSGRSLLTFCTEAEDMPASAMVRMFDTSIPAPARTVATRAAIEMPRAGMRSKSGR